MTTTTRRGSVIALALAGAIGCGGGGAGPDAGPAEGPPPDAVTGAVPRVEDVPCRYDVPASLGLAEGTGYACGDLLAWEDRATAAALVRVHYVRFTSPAATGRATIYLDGGPGGDGARMVARVASLGTPFLDGLLVDGDFVIIAQRGTRLAVPSLADDLGDAVLAAYTTASNADDVDELRAALGYDQLNLFGISYGSRLGLEVLRRHGANVRAASLGGLVPAQTLWPAEIPASAHGALAALDASCAADAGCGPAFGDLVELFVAGVDALDAAPVTIDGGLELDGYTYANLLFSLLYARSSYPWLPLVISELAARRTTEVEGFLADALEEVFGRDGVSLGLYYAIVCGELFNPPDDAGASAAEEGVPADFVRIYGDAWPGLRGACDGLDVGPSRAALAAPVASAVPTLIDSGALDPITPPRFGDVAAATLSAATIVTLADSGHGALLQSPCGHALLHAFLADPTATLDTSCAAEVATAYELPQSVVRRSVPRAALAFELDLAPRPARR